MSFKKKYYQFKYVIIKSCTTFRLHLQPRKKTYHYNHNIIYQNLDDDDDVTVVDLQSHRWQRKTWCRVTNIPFTSVHLQHRTIEFRLFWTCITLCTTDYLLPCISNFKSTTSTEITTTTTTQYPHYYRRDNLLF